MKTKYEIHPKLTLVGAGPGDPELISLKGINALSNADVVLYDALVNTELLKYVPIHARKIFVGKRKGQHSFTQDQINTLIVDYAFSHGHVVRLKGGDPFVFGRGYEELEFADSFNIETQIVPGISSSVAVPALQRIPVTHRGSSESFWVIAGTTSSGKLSRNLQIAAQTNATVVVLMGLAKLKEIAGIYRAAGKGDLPVAVIQDGSLPTENIAVGSIDTIAEEVAREKIASPAIIIIGEVVRKNTYAEQQLKLENYLFN
ncbi:MAG: uroporphyrin-III C-methyltransferase [Bacteroidetes bacterium]|nr:MAG: uroporphyrin-III C-methyltransferase [Bacteroidota bacterium]